MSSDQTHSGGYPSPIPEQGGEVRMKASAPQRQRCIFLLSLKSCGSSVLQRKLVEVGNARLIEHTPHSENETLFWTKAASVLGLPQFRMENSEVPIAKARAEAMLRSMIRANSPNLGDGPLSTEEDIFAGWTAILSAGTGTLIEKSPHHLYQPAAIALMERYADQSDVDVRFIGLIRNPIDTLYSSWRRFGVAPEREEKHWVRGYALLRALRERRPGSVSIVRYEDLIDGSADIGALAGATAASKGGEVIHSASLQKWRSDKHFGYSPSEHARDLARSYGYTDEQLTNSNAGSWALHRVPRALAWSAFSRLPFATQRRMKQAATLLLRRGR